MMYDWTEECGEYGNHHEMFHIAQDNLKKEDVTKALNDILGEDGWAMDGALEEHGAYFSTAKESVDNLTKSLSCHFPNAICFGQDAWDNEGYIVCYKNNKPSFSYHAEFSHCDAYDESDEYYDVELVITAENGYFFNAGGGMVYKDEIGCMTEFIEKGSL